jgi:CrcB protein
VSQEEPRRSFAVRTRRSVVPPAAVVAVAIGGALGAPSRYLLGRALHVAGGVPMATLTVNLSGAFVLGALLVLASERFPPTRFLRPFFGTGVLGAYTTYSTFAVETDLLVRHERIGIAVGYVAATVLGGLFAAWAGVLLARAAPLLGRSS